MRKEEKGDEGNILFRRDKEMRWGKHYEWRREKIIDMCKEGEELWRS